MGVTILYGVVAFFITGVIAEFFSTRNTRSVVLDDCPGAVVTGVLVDVCRWGSLGSALVTPSDLWVKAVLAAGYFAGVGSGIYLGMRGMQLLQQAIKAFK